MTKNTLIVPESELTLIKFLKSICSTLYLVLFHDILYNDKLVYHFWVEIQSIADEYSCLGIDFASDINQNYSNINVDTLTVKLTTKQELVDFLFKAEEIIYCRIIFNEETEIEDNFLDKHGQSLHELATQMG